MIIHLVNNSDDLVKHWSFLWNGFVSLTDPKIGRQEVTEETYQKMMLGLALNLDSVLAIGTNAKGLPLGFVGAQIVFSLQAVQEVRIHVLFSSGKDKDAYQSLMKYVTSWAYGKGVNTLSITSGRINGSSMRFFESKLGFHRAEVVFKKTIV